MGGCASGWVCDVDLCVPADASATHEDSGESWTVLVYMAADNDLEPFALLDLLEMMEVGATTNFRFVVQLDRADGCLAEGKELCDLDRRGSFGNDPGSRRVLVTKQGLELIDDLGEVDMGSPDTLAEFIAWGIGTYPADRFALVFWDHGGGWTGFGQDVDPKSWMNLDSIRQGVSAGLQTAGRDRFELLGFDACLMAAFEVAMSLRPFGEYFLASEELEPGHGWDWRSFATMRDKPSAPVPEVTTSIAKGFLQQATQLKTSGVTLSTLDLLALGEVEAAVIQLRTAVESGGIGARLALGRARAHVQRFAANPDPAKDQHVIDLGHLASLLVAEGVSEASQLEQAISEVVVESIADGKSPNAKGISVYFPSHAQYYRPDYDAIASAAPWRGVLRSYYQLAAEEAVAPAFVGDATWDFATSPSVVRATLTPSSTDSIVEIKGYFGIKVDESYVLVLDELGLLDGDTISSPWSGDAVWVSQGTAESLVFGSAALDISGQPSGLIPFQTQLGDTAQLRFFFNSQGGLESTWYIEDSNGGFGEWSPGSGDTVRPLLLVADQTGDRWEAVDTEFDASMPLVLEARSLFSPSTPITLVALVCATSLGGVSSCAGALADAVPEGSDGVDATDGVDGFEGVEGQDGIESSDGIDGDDGIDGGDGVEGTPLGCTSEDLIGSCIGDTLLSCDADGPYSIDCGPDGSCEFDPLANGGQGVHFCAEASSCPPESALRECIGNTLFYCEDGEEKSLDCGDGFTCDFDPEGNEGTGWFDCMEDTSTDGSCTLEETAGICDGPTTLTYCEDGVTQTYECADGETCQWDPSGNGGLGWFNCIP